MANDPLDSDASSRNQIVTWPTRILLGFIIAELGVWEVSPRDFEFNLFPDKNELCSIQRSPGLPMFEGWTQKWRRVAGQPGRLNEKTYPLHCGTSTYYFSVLRIL